LTADAKREYTIIDNLPPPVSGPISIPSLLLHWAGGKKKEIINPKNHEEGKRNLVNVL